METTAPPETFDPNNNNKTIEVQEVGDVPDDDSTQVAKSCEKYSLRPRSVASHVETEKKKCHKKEPKPKQRPPPLSKYRRKTANARERYRMLEMNQAFETLRRVIPNFPTQKTESKVTKVTTLKLAVNYIKALSQILDESNPCDGSSPSGNNSMCVPNVAIPSSQYPGLGITLCHSLAMQQSLLPREVLNSAGDSSSDFGDLFSEEGSTMGDNLCDTAFEDIQSLPVTDTCFDMFMESDGESLAFSSDISDYNATP